MKKLILASLALTCALGAFAQGTVVFNNRVSGTLVTYVYAPLATDRLFHQIGNGADSTPAGTTDWSKFTKISGSGYLATLMSAPTAGAAESALAFASVTSSFRTGGAAGNVAGITLTLPNVAAGANIATLQMFAWDNSDGKYATAQAAWDAWKNGDIAGGVSGTFNLEAIGGGLNSNPNLTGLQSFNLYYVPEPSSMALAGLGAAALLIFRRRK
jgi:hypothetical protein